MVRVSAEFVPGWSIAWITTYTFEPTFYESFLLRRLGEPPLNAVVLADFDRLAATWSAVEPEDLWGIRGANRRYLVRGVRTGQGAFHAKTILLADSTKGTLLVGSGNVGLGGLERGWEVYARYSSSDEAEATAFAAWRGWMDRIVSMVDDQLLRSRWADVLGRASWLDGPSGGSPFVTNLDAPLIDALLAGTSAPVDEMRATAPFFDTDLGALRAIIERAHPRRLMLYLGRDVSVDGQRLSSLLANFSGEVAVLRYEPSAYVHAKLVALVRGSKAVVLSGSANLSRPALLSVAGADTGANVEAGNIAEMPQAELDAVFCPPELSVVPASADEVVALRLEAPDPATSYLHRLLSATATSGQEIRLVIEPSGDGLSLSDGSETLAIDQDRVSGAFTAREGATLVWLANAVGEQVSNRVALDEYTALQRMLNQRTGVDDRPAELDELDIDHPLGLLLAELHQRAVFDVDDTPAAKRLRDLAGERAAEDPEFWERLLREELAIDPRASRYGGAARQPTLAMGMDDDLTWLLNQMLDRVPVRGVLHLVGGDQVTREERERQGKPWTPTQRLATRAYNVLYRWSLALADPRVRWFGGHAPIRHYDALLGAILRIWQQGDWLAEHRVVRLLETLFGALIRTDRSLGYLASLPPEERRPALEALRATASPSIAAGLAYAALRTAPPSTFFSWQPYLVPGLEWGIFAASAPSAEVVASVTSGVATPDQIRGRLRYVADYVDDDHWCARTAEQLALKAVRLGAVKNDFYPLQIEVDGRLDLLTDPRLVVLAREAGAYRNALGLRLVIGDDVLTFSVGRPIYARVQGVDYETAQVTNAETLAFLESRSHGFGAVLRRESSAAS